MEQRPSLPARTETIPASVGGKCKEFIHIPATSVPSECIFSLAGYIVRDRRSKILAANVPWPQQQSEGNARSDRCIFDFEDDIVDASSYHFFSSSVYFQSLLPFLPLCQFFGGKIYLSTRINSDLNRIQAFRISDSRFSIR